MATIGKVSREDFRKQKELDEARKAGTAPAEVDEEGRDINPHIPQYVTKTPWYLGFEHATLKHQRQDEAKIEKVTPLDEHERYKKGVKKDAPKAKTFRKGACENCGAMTHKKKDCVERPRKLGAVHTKTDIAPDEYLPNLEEKINFEGKRDRWRGYNPAEYQRVVERYDKIEEEKRKQREKQLREEKFQQGTDATDGDGDGGAKAADHDSDSSSEGEGDEDDAKYAEGANMIQKFDAKNRVSVRNLRIREDTAKYLHNLDVNSAYYDPKTRTMRANPYEGTGKDPKQVPFAGDNFIRYNGDVVDVAQRQMFAWDATAKGEELHAQADPTLAEKMYKRFQDKRENFKATQQKSVLEKYGGEEHLKAPPKELLLAQSEHYVEYSKLGRVIKGQDKAIARSKYLEDQYPGNHKSVWGSYWRNGQWGYACCHSLFREAYCAGEAGKAAAALSDKPFLAVEHAGGAAAVEEEPAEKSMVELHRERQAKDAADAAAAADNSSEEDDSDGDEASRKERKKKRKKERKERKRRKNNDDDEDEDEDAVRAKKIREAMKKQQAEDAAAEELLKTDERSRKYGAIGGSVEEPTEEEMEAYRLRQGRADDPMNNFLTRS